VSLRCPELLSEKHRLESFDCGKPALNDWLLRHARQAQGSGSAKAFAVADYDRVASYFSVMVGQIDTLEVPERIRRGDGPIPDSAGGPDASGGVAAGGGIGISLLQDVIRRTLMIAEQAGIRAMLTHPIDAEAARCYTRFGFVASPLRDQQLLHQLLAVSPDHDFQS